MPILGSNKDDSETLYFGPPTSPYIFDFSPKLLNTNWTFINLNKEDSYYEHLEKQWLKQVPVETNSREFRSDEFLPSSLHIGKHILFAGCSNTFGDGLLKEETWPHKVYTEIKKDTALSGYFNIGFPGISIVQIISWIFKYIKEFGNPDIIFALLPDTSRFIGVSARDHEELFGTVMLREKDFSGDRGQYLSSKRLIEYFVFEMYSMLEMYCLSNGIQLIASAWTKPENEFSTISVLKDFETFFSMDINKDEEPRFVYNYIEKHDPDTTFNARDGIHQGEAANAYWAFKMLKEYYGENYENPWS